MAGIDHNQDGDHNHDGDHNQDGDCNQDGHNNQDGDHGGEQTSGRGNGEDSSPESHSWEAVDAEPLETERLALNDEEERLPWLQSGDDDEADYAGVDSGRMARFLLAGLVSLAAIVGGIWWVTNRNADQAAIADGSVIEAPKTPASEKPKDPGGKTFDGTGDTSFAVSEGQTRPARLGGEASSAAAKPAPAPPATAAGTATPAPSPSATAPVPSGVGVQVGAFSSNASAEAAWTKLAQQHSALSGVRHQVVQGSADIGTVYRLQALAGDRAAATALCIKLKAGGLSCQVK